MAGYPRPPRALGRADSETPRLSIIQTPPFSEDRASFPRASLSPPYDADLLRGRVRHPAVEPISLEVVTGPKGRFRSDGLVVAHLREPIGASSVWGSPRRRYGIFCPRGLGAGPSFRTYGGGVAMSFDTIKGADPAARPTRIFATSKRSRTTRPVRMTPLGLRARASPATWLTGTAV